MIIEVIFDVETQKLFSDITTEDPADLGISVVSVYRRILNNSLEEIAGEMKSFWHQDARISPLIADMWPWFEEADRIIGFNSKHFDVPALRPHYEKDLTKLPHFDMLEIVHQRLGRRISLNALAKDTLGDAKTDVGTNAVLYWANRTKESMEKLQSYCEADVMLTTKLYDFGQKNKYLKYTDKWNNASIVEVDFSYPKKKQELQIGLF